MHETTICCADIGSVAKGNFGWAGLSGKPDGEESSGNDIRRFAAFVARSLAAEEKVALGFECPLRNLSTTMGHSTGLIREQCPVW